MCPALTLPDDGSEPKTVAEMHARHKAVMKRLWNVRREVFAPPLQKYSAEPPPPQPPPKAIRTFEPEPIETRVVTNIIGKGKPTVTEIVRIVSRYFDLTPTQVTSPRRQVEFCYARQIIYHLCRDVLDKSFPVIGRALGDRDHTTILHGCKKLNTRIAAGDEAAISDVAACRRMLGVPQLSTLPLAACTPHDNDNRVGTSSISEIEEAPS